MTRAFEVSRAHYIIVAGHCTCSVTDKCATYLALQDLYDAGRRSGIEVSAMAIETTTAEVVERDASALWAMEELPDILRALAAKEPTNG